MIVANVPVIGLGTMIVLGLTSEDLTKMAAGEVEPDLIDFRKSMQVGIPLPVVMQIICVKDAEEFNARMNAWLESYGAEPNPMEKFVEVKDLPKLFEDDE